MRNISDYRSKWVFPIIVVCCVLVASILSCQAPFATPEVIVVTVEVLVEPTENIGVTLVPPTSLPDEVPTDTPPSPTDTITVAPQNTPTNIATSTPQVSVASFSDSSWLTVPPDDILEQLAYGGMGGGGGDGEDVDICDELFPTPEIIYEYAETIELFRSSWITVCGLTPDEFVSISQYRPDGEIVVEDIVADLSGGLIYKFEPTFGDLVGQYVIDFSSSSGNSAAAVTVTEPDGPRLVELEDDVLLLLYNYAPNESVRLFVYTHQGRTRNIYAWQELRIDGKGQLLVEMDLPPAPSDLEFFRYYTYHAVGDVSNPGGDDLIYFPCPGAMRPRLSFEMPARVTYTDGRPLNVRAKPGYSGEILRQIPEGYQIYIFFGPECVDGVYWWSFYDEGMQGWIAEGDEDMYFIEPWFEE
ncbi:MAG: SH3 domain-containing protein [Anaerolineales bacterium]|nr:SH3 domain-containing protein [Anaerolineales bacterium]